MKNMKVLVAVTCSLGLWGGRALAQPTYTAPTTGDLSGATDTSATAQADTLVSPMETGGMYNGFTKIFDGSSFKGWWQDVHTGHSNGNTSGAIYRIAPAQHAIYSTQRNGNIGGILVTHKKQKFYEVIFDIWPSYGDDGGFFNRVTLDGACFQTVLDYIDAGSYGGTWGEGTYVGRDYRQSMFNGNDSTLTIPGNGGANWTTFTASQNPTSFGCPAGGCTQADWRKLWDLYGWNTTRIKFWGGLTSAQPTVHMKSWFLTKTKPRHWVPLWTDTTLTLTAQQMTQWPTNPSGFQVHGSGRFGGANGNWYKNIYMRQLNEVSGAPTTGPATPDSCHTPGSDVDTECASTQILNHVGSAPAILHGSVDGVSGVVDQDHEVRVTDIRGHVLENFSGHAGAFNYTFSSGIRGLLFVELKTAKGSQFLRISRI